MTETKPQQLPMFARQYIAVFEMPDGTFEQINTLENDSRRAAAFREKNKDLYYWSKSGLHKSIRRRDFPRAMAFANLLDMAKKNESRRYLRSVLFEETRNWALLAKFYDDCMPTSDLIRLACQSTKDWEMTGDRGIFSEDWYRVAAKYGWDAVNYETAPIGYPFPDLDESKPIYELVTSMCGKSDWESLYDLVVCCTTWTPNGNEAQRPVRRALIDWISDSIPDLAKYVHHARPVSGHCEELIGLWHLASGTHDFDESCAFPHAVDMKTKMDFPMLDFGILDNHTREGKRRHRLYERELDWGKPQHPKMEIRWTGAHAGTLWRHLCWEQYGTVLRDFHDVRIPGPILDDFRAVRSPMR